MGGVTAECHGLKIEVRKVPRKAVVPVLMSGPVVGSNTAGH
jgi:hypothetical protein